MSLATFPLIAWGTPSDISASPWGNIGTPTVTGGQADPFGGTGAYTIEDDDAGIIECRVINFTTTLTTAWVVVFVQQGTASQSVIGMYDTTAAEWRHRVRLTWGGGSYTASTETGAGTILTPISCGGGWWAQVFSATSIIPANTQRLYLFGAGSTGSSTGTTLYYVRNAVLLDLVHNYRRFPRVREGYDAASNGVTRTAWSYGDEWVRRGTVHWVPPIARSWPVAVSGFTGANESTGVNCGVEAMLRAGWNMNALTWVPDRSACSVNQSVYLTAPTRDWEPSEEGSGEFLFDLELVTGSAPGAVP